MAQHIQSSLPTRLNPEEQQQQDYQNDDSYNLGSRPEEHRMFNHITRPDDSYTVDGVYWADLPLRQRIQFVSKVDAQAVRDELRTIGTMVKKDPLSPLGWYTRNAIIPGAGLGLEGYVLFSIGNLEPLFSKVWPECWKTHETCSKNWVASVTYLEIIGIMVGQAVVGVSSAIPLLLTPLLKLCL